LKTTKSNCTLLCKYRWTRWRRNKSLHQKPR